MAVNLTPSQPYTLRLRKTVAPLSVLSWAGVESISQPYRLEIEFTSVVSGIPVADVLGKPAQFLIEPIDPSAGLLGLVVSAVKPPERTFNGLITQFDQLSSSPDQTHYRVVLEPRLADLQREVASRLFQNQTVPAIIEAVLRHYDYSAIDFQFKLRAEYESREYTTQYNESALAFIQRIAADEGIWFRFEQTDEREVLVFGDDLDAYFRDPKLSIAWQKDAGLESVGAESIKTLSQYNKRVIQNIAVDDYNHRTAGIRLLSAINTAHADSTTHGTQYRWGEHHSTPAEGQRFAVLRHQAELATQITFEGSGNAVALTPGAVLRLSNRNLPDATHGLLLTHVTHKASRQDAYVSTFKAMPSDRIYRTRIDTIPQPRINGTIPARITSPDQYQYAYLTPQGHYRVQLPFDLDIWSPGGTSRPVRFSKPYAGRDYGHHFPLIDGTEVSLVFTDGNPDRPIIIGAMHDSQHGDHVTNQNNTRNIIRTAAQNELRMEDRRETEHIHLTTPYQTSELNLGHMVNPQLEERGQGAELRTDGHAAIRAAKGIFISADAQPNASGKQLDMQAALALLNQALIYSQTMADIAQTAKANAAEHEKQKALLDQSLSQLKQAGILISAPQGIGITSGDHLQLSASKNLIVTSGGNTDISVIKKFTVAAGEAVSLFAQKLGMKLFAAKGKVEIQAQSDEMNLASLKDTTITSTNGKIVLNAKKEIWIGAGGSYIKITPTGIENATPGEINEKCVAWDKQQAASKKHPMPVLPEGDLLGKQSLRFAAIGSDEMIKDSGWVGKRYQILSSAGIVLIEGKIPNDGRIPRVDLDNPDTVTLKVGSDDWEMHQLSSPDQPDKDERQESNDNFLGKENDPFHIAEINQSVHFLGSDDISRIIQKDHSCLAGNSKE